MRSSLAVTICLIAVWLPPATSAQTQMPPPHQPQAVAPTIHTDPSGVGLVPGSYAAQSNGPSLSRHLLYGAATGGALSLMLIGMADCPNSGCIEARAGAVVGYTVAGAAIGGVVYLIRKVLTGLPGHVAR